MDVINKLITKFNNFMEETKEILSEIETASVDSLPITEAEYSESEKVEEVTECTDCSGTGLKGDVLCPSCAGTGNK